MTENEIDDGLSATLDWCRENNVFFTGDFRISARDAAKFIGYCESTLKQMRADQNRNGPRWIPKGAGYGSKVSYFLTDLIKWRYENPR